jgi:hypothetical protein
MIQDGLLSDGANLQGDLMADAERRDIYPAFVSVQDEGHRHKSLECVALGATAGRNIGFSAGNAHREIKNARDRFSGEARTAVRNRDASLIDVDIDLRRYVGLFAGIQGIVEQFLKRHEGPIGFRMAGLRDEFLLTAKVHQTACLEGRAIEDGDRLLAGMI